MLSTGVRGVCSSRILSKFGQIVIEPQSRHAATLFMHGMGNRHRDPKWKKHRANQTLRVKLPDFDRARNAEKGKVDRNEVRAEYIKHGVSPSRTWEEKPFFVSTLSGIAEPYVPLEGDGKASLLSKAGALQKMEQLKKRATFERHLRKLKQYEPEFKVADFPAEAFDIYVKAHDTLATDPDKEKLFKLVTEGAYPEMIENARLKTLRWKMLGSLEPPRVVHMVTQSLMNEDDMFAQITVRMHTQQTLAVYDRFGRLLHGSEVMVKDVLEYVVFEKQISNIYGLWRLHGKIIPDWKPKKEPSKRTFIEEVEEETPKKESVSVVDPVTPTAEKTDGVTKEAQA